MALGATLKESKILLDSISGLQTILGEICADFGKPPIKVVVVASTWIQRELMQQYGSIEFPFLGISLQRFARNAESYNDNLRRSGIAIGKVDDNKVNIYKLVPIIANFRLRYLTQDFNDLIAFASRWLLRQKDLQFSLDNEEFSVSVRVKLNEDLSMPDQENNDWGVTFQLETDLDMQTYIGEVETQTKITKIVLTPSIWDSSKHTIVSGSKPRTIKINTQ
jgi:hypothetical protein